MPLARDEAAGTVRFMVRKFEGGVWHEKEFTAVEKATIGEKDPGSGVDYGTGATFLRVVVDRQAVEEERELLVFDLQGRVRLAGDAPIVERIRQERVVETEFALIRNELGEEERLAFEAR